MICFEGVSFAYQDKTVLSGVSFCAGGGRITGVLGPNGSGKTTLLRLAQAALLPQTGSVTLCGRDTREYTARERARKLALVPQSSSMDFDFTVREVVLMGRSPYLGRFAAESGEDERIAREAMALTRVDALADRPVTRLSGGEWQRVVVARALAQQTPVLLLDEPVSSLDVLHQVEVLGLMARLAHGQGKCVLCVLHDLNLAAQFCDDIALLRGGELVAFGVPEEVLPRAGEAYGLPLITLPHPVTGKLCVFPHY